jgi:hypothetical protein
MSHTLTAVGRVLGAGLILVGVVVALLWVIGVAGFGLLPAGLLALGGWWLLKREPDAPV